MEKGEGVQSEHVGVTIWGRRTHYEEAFLAAVALDDSPSCGNNP